MANRGKSKARIAATVGISLFAAYVIFIIVLIAREPAPGADSPQELADSFVSGLEAGDESAIERLFAEDAIADGYVAQLLDQVKDGGALNATIVSQGDSSTLVLRQSGRPGCVDWAVLPEGQRVSLSGVPPFSSC